MKKFLFLILVSVSISAQSQTFVNDIDRLAVLVIDFFVDKNGVRQNETINQEKST